MEVSDRQSRGQAEKCMVTIQEFLWGFISAVWENRCQFIHGSDQVKKSSNTRNELNAIIDQMQADKSKVGAADLYLFTQEERICTTSVRNMNLLVNSVQLAVRKEAWIRQQ